MLHSVGYLVARQLNLLSDRQTRYASEHIVLISFSACHGDARNLYGARCSGIGYVRVYDFVLRLCDDAACNDAECGQHLSYIHCLLIVLSC